MTLPAAGEAPVEIHLDLTEKKKGFWLVQWWRPAFENWKDAHQLFRFYCDIPIFKKGQPFHYLQTKDMSSLQETLDSAPDLRRYRFRVLFLDFMGF